MCNHAPLYIATGLFAIPAAHHERLRRACSADFAFSVTGGIRLKGTSQVQQTAPARVAALPVTVAAVTVAAVPAPVATVPAPVAAGPGQGAFQIGSEGRGSTAPSQTPTHLPSHR